MQVLGCLACPPTNEKERGKGPRMSILFRPGPQALLDYVQWMLPTFILLPCLFQKQAGLRLV